MIRRINLWGGPSAGKSRTAARLFADLKDCKSNSTSKLEIELVREYVKDWAWANRPIEGWDQLHIFSEQLRREETLLRSGVDVIVTDCPIGLNAFYAYDNKLIFNQELVNMAFYFEEQYPSVHLVLKKPKIYHEKGRYHSKEEATALHSKIIDYLWNVKYIVCDDYKTVLNQSLNALGMDYK